MIEVTSPQSRLFEYFRRQAGVGTTRASDASSESSSLRATSLRWEKLVALEGEADFENDVEEVLMGLLGEHRGSVKASLRLGTSIFLHDFQNFIVFYKNPKD